MKIITILGARPQFIKAAAVSRAISEYNNHITHDSQRIYEIIVHTGQHFDENMSDIFFRELQIPKPDFHLGVNSLSHGAMTGRMMENIENILIENRPEWVLVYGDTNSTLAGALAAAKLHIPVAHVEAGLRSYNHKMPEEINRVLTDHVSTLLFCPTQIAVKNLSFEGIKDGVRQVGDVMFDAFLFYKAFVDKDSSILSRLEIKKKEYYLATVHREENTDDPDHLNSILSAFNELGTTERPIIFPMHPRTRKKIDLNKFAGDHNGPVRIIQPLGYLDMIALETNAVAIFTDSGGIQKEAFFSRVPCITLRNETEWVETLESGWNILAGTDEVKILNAVHQAMSLSKKDWPSYYGSGDSARQILDELMVYT